jgi:hypothetical protein
VQIEYLERICILVMLFASFFTAMADVVCCPRSYLTSEWVTWAPDLADSDAAFAIKDSSPFVFADGWRAARRANTG